MRKNFLAWFIPLLVITILPAQRTWAWIDTGHKIVAMIAWEDLTPKTRAAITEFLQKHPRYEKDLLLEAPEGATPEQLAQHAFATAATWPAKAASMARST